MTGQRIFLALALLCSICAARADQVTTNASGCGAVASGNIVSGQANGTCGDSGGTISGPTTFTSTLGVGSGILAGGGEAGGGGTSLVNEASPELPFYGTSGNGTETTPFSNSSDNTAGIQTVVNYFEAGRGGYFELSPSRYNMSTSVVLNQNGISGGCKDFTYNADINTVHGSGQATWGCTLNASSALTNGFFDYQLASGVSVITGSNLTNLSMWGINNDGNDGSIGVNVPVHLNVTHFDRLNIGNVAYGYYFGADCDTCTIFSGNLTADGFGIFWSPSDAAGTEDMHMLGMDISDNKYEGLADFANYAASPWIYLGNDMQRDASTLASYTASIGSATSATATGTGSTTNLTLSAVTGKIYPGSAAKASISGTGVPGSTYLVSQTSGTTGGAGVYVTNNNTTASGAAITVTSSVMNVSAVIGGFIAKGKYVNGSGITANTVHVVGPETGVGGTGTYVLDASLTISSEAMTSPGANVYNSSPTMIIGNDIEAAGYQQQNVTNVSADGLLLTGAFAGTQGGLIADNYIQNPNGCNVRVTGSYYLIADNWFGSNSAGCASVFFDTPSSKNSLFSPMPISFTNSGTYNNAFYVDLTRGYHIISDANPILTLASDAQSAAGNAALNLDNSALSGGKWQLSAGAGGSLGNFFLYDYGTGHNAINVSTSDVVTIAYGLTVTNGAGINVNNGANPTNIGTGTTSGGVGIGGGSNVVTLGGGSNSGVALGSSVYANCTALTTASGVLGCTASDRRLKLDDGTITPAAGLAAILGMPDAHMFHFRDGYGPAGHLQGFFAQDVQQVRPDLVTTAPPTELTPDGTLRFDQVTQIADLVMAVKAQQSEIVWLRAVVGLMLVWMIGLTVFNARRLRRS